MKDFQEFLVWEKSSKDTIDFKRVYADMAGDTLAGLVLSQIVYWHIPNKQGLSKLRIQKEGDWWIACTRAEWWESTRLTPRQIDRVLQILEDKHLIVKKVFKFAGSPTVHVRINHDVFVMSHNSYIANPIPNPYATEKKDISPSDITDSLNGNVANGDMKIDESVKSLTETTAKTTTEKKSIAPKVAKPYYDAIASILDIHGGQNVDMQKMLEGVSKKKGYAEYNMNPPVPLDEFKHWGKLAKKEYGDYMVKSPAKVNGGITKMREILSRTRTSQSLQEVDIQIFTENKLATDGVIQFNRRAK